MKHKLCVTTITAFSQWIFGDIYCLSSFLCRMAELLRQAVLFQPPAQAANCHGKPLQSEYVCSLERRHQHLNQNKCQSK